MYEMKTTILLTWSFFFLFSAPCNVSMMYHGYPDYKTVPSIILLCENRIQWGRSKLWNFFVESSTKIVTICL